MLTASEEPPPVWPDANGTVRGVALQPLHHSVPLAVKEDSALYEMLAFIDALREGGRRTLLGRSWCQSLIGGRPSYKEL